MKRAHNLLHFFCVSLLANGLYAMNPSDDYRFEGFKITSGTAILGKPLRVCEDFTQVQNNTTMPFFAVFDGNGGKEAAEYAKGNLYSNLLSEWEEKNVCIDTAIKAAFAATNNGINGLKKKHVGSTAVTVFFSTKATGLPTMHVAHTGDSRAILGVWSDEGIKADQLTIDHRPSTSSEEERIKAVIRTSDQEGAILNPPGSPYKRKDQTKKEDSPTKFRKTDSPLHQRRLFAEFDDENSPPLPQRASIFPTPWLPSTCITINEDQEFTKTWGARSGLSITRCFGRKSKNKHGLSFEPEIKHIILKPQYQFVILYSDGVGDHITPQAAVNHVFQKLKETNNLDDIAFSLIKTAALNDPHNHAGEEEENGERDYFKRGIKDDMSVVIVLLN